MLSKRLMKRCIIFAAAMTLLPASRAPGATVLLEAEQSGQRGGWVVDPQFMDQMGSPYLLAHGLGSPVADAVAETDLPEAGVYRVWVRTMDWVARWKAPGAPGRFEVVFNGRPLPRLFGTEGAQWHWQDGGRVELTAGRTAVALHDLTGFEGRCDALLLTTDDRLVPPNADPGMASFRRRLLGLPEAPERAGEFDLLVAGGGMAGACAAVAAARLGLQVALVQDRPVIGGNNSSEVRVWLQGARNKEPWPRVGDVVAELDPPRRAHYGPDNTADLYEDAARLAVVRAEPNLRLFLEHRVNGVEMDGGRIRAAVAQDIIGGRRFRLGARWFADCTGDGALGALAGADSDMTPKGHMGLCNLWNVAETPSPVPFPRCPWALDLADRPFPGRDAKKPDPLKLGGWYWESGFDRDPITELERVRDWNFRAMYGAWDAMKNVDRVLPNHRLNWAAFIMGKRESRRLLGDVVLSLDDLKTGRQFPDACAPTGWKVDLHLPDPRYEKGFEGDAFISKADFDSYPMPFWIPYRCLYSRNVPNLFMAGRDISVTHEALGAVRVMRTGGCMGEVVGMAASVCQRRGTDPRGVYDRHLPDLQELMRRGVGRNPAAAKGYANQGEPAPARRPTAAPAPASPAWTGTNHALAARVTAPAGRDDAHPPGLLTDGRADLADNEGRWISDAGLPQDIEFAWEEPREINAARVVSGYRSGGDVIAPLAAFSFQFHDGTAWHDIPGAAARSNARAEWSARFDPVRAHRVRLHVTETKDDTSRIWEIELYRTGD